MIRQKRWSAEIGENAKTVGKQAISRPFLCELRVLWVGPRPAARTPVPIDAWPHPGDDAPNVKRILGPERGSDAVAAGGAREVRRRARQTRGGANSSVRFNLRKLTFHGAGGILFLLSPFINAVSLPISVSPCLSGENLLRKSSLSAPATASRACAGGGWWVCRRSA